VKALQAELGEERANAARDDALDYRVIEQSQDAFAFDVTAYRYADFYRQLGEPDLGFLLVCGADFAVAEGFGPDIKFDRTQTIMQGASHCDFSVQMIKVCRGGIGRAQGTFDQQHWYVAYWHKTDQQGRSRASDDRGGPEVEAAVKPTRMTRNRPRIIPPTRVQTSGPIGGDRSRLGSGSGAYEPTMLSLAALVFLLMS